MSEKLNITELSKRFGLDRATIKTRLDEGGAKGKRSGNQVLYDLAEVASLIESDHDLLYDRERALKTKIERETKELDLKERRGELVEIKTVRDDLGRMFQKLIQKLETQMPYEIAGALFKAESPEQCQTILRRTISGIFQDVRKEHEGYLTQQ